MSVPFTCTHCGKVLRAREELAGRSIKCPDCGTVLHVPESVQPASAQIDRGLASAASTPPAKSRKRRKHSRIGPAEPLVNIGGMDLTAMRLIVGAVVLAAVGSGLFLVLSRPVPRLKAQRVDVYAAVAGIEHRVFQRPTLLISRPNPRGEFILVKFKVPNKQFEERFAGARGLVQLPASEIQLQGGDKTTTPLFLVNQFDSDSGHQLRYAGGALFAWERTVDGDVKMVKTPSPLYQCLGPRAASPWQCAGKLEINKPAKSHFRGEQGLTVEFEHLELKASEIGAARPEELKEVRKQLDELNQQVRVSWDADASGWLATESVEEPGERFLLGWELTCVFPLPAAVENPTLVVLGKSMPLAVGGK